VASSARSTSPTRRQGVVDTAIGIEGLKRQWGVHAAGVIMSSEPLIDVIPMMRREQDGAIITQFDYPTCETLGLIKMDFLGLRNLTVLDDALENIEMNRGETGRPRGAPARRPGRPTSCWPAATPSASSSSTAARCGRCCG
jgi:DNA polymerase III alpha subunit